MYSGDRSPWDDAFCDYIIINWGMASLARKIGQKKPACMLDNAMCHMLQKNYGMVNTHFNCVGASKYYNIEKATQNRYFNLCYAKEHYI